MPIYQNMQIPVGKSGGALPTDDSAGYSVYVPGSKNVQALDSSGYALAARAGEVIAESQRGMTEGLQNFGRSLKKVGDVAWEIEQKNRELDMAKVQDYLSRVKSNFLNWREQRSEQKGADAVGAPMPDGTMGRDVRKQSEDFTAMQRRADDRFLSKVGPYARVFARRELDEVYEHDRAWTNEYFYNQSQAYQDSQHDAFIAAEADTAMANIDKPDLFSQSVGKVKAMYEIAGKRKGWSPEDVQKHYRDFLIKLGTRGMKAKMDAQDIPGARNFVSFISQWLPSDVTQSFNAEIDDAEFRGLREGLRADNLDAVANARKMLGASEATGGAPASKAAPAVLQNGKDFNAVAKSVFSANKGTPWSLSGQLGDGSGKVSCSGLVGSVMAQAGQPEYYKQVSETQLDMAMENKGVSVEEARNKPRAGLIIGLDHGPKAHDKGRAKGIDHVAVTFQDPANGEIMVLESSVGKGVRVTPVKKWFDARPVGPNNKVKQMWVGDALYGRTVAVPQPGDGGGQAGGAQGGANDVRRATLAADLRAAEKRIGRNSMENAAVTDPEAYLRTPPPQRQKLFGVEPAVDRDGENLARSILRGRDEERNREKRQRIVDAVNELKGMPFGALNVPYAEAYSKAAFHLNNRKDLSPDERREILAHFAEFKRGEARDVAYAEAVNIFGQAVGGGLQVEQARRMVSDSTLLMLDPGTRNWLSSRLDDLYSPVSSSFSGAYKAYTTGKREVPTMYQGEGDRVFNEGFARAQEMWENADAPTRKKWMEMMQDPMQRSKVPPQQILDSALWRALDVTGLQRIVSDKAAQKADEMDAERGKRLEKNMNLVKRAFYGREKSLPLYNGVVDEEAVERVLAAGFRPQPGGVGYEQYVSGEPIVGGIQSFGTGDIENTYGMSDEATAPKTVTPTVETPEYGTEARAQAVKRTSEEAVAEAERRGGYGSTEQRAKAVQYQLTHSASGRRKVIDDFVRGLQNEEKGTK